MSSSLESRICAIYHQICFALTNTLYGMNQTLLSCHCLQVVLETSSLRLLFLFFEILIDSCIRIKLGTLVTKLQFGAAVLSANQSIMPAAFCQAA